MLPPSLIRFLVILVGLNAIVATGLAADISTIWGESGGCWSSASRIPDFSVAGYRNGANIPMPAVTANVRSFGAVGDGITDDSQAFLRALETMSTGALLIPAGRYRLTKVLPITRSGIVLRGEGRDRSVLFFPKPLEQVVGNGLQYAPAGSWSWSGGFIAFNGGNRGRLLTRVTRGALRGSRELAVASTRGMSVGQTIRLVQTDFDGSLGRRLHDDQASTSADLRSYRLIDFSAKVQAIRGDRVELNRPIRIDIETRWQPEIHTDEWTVVDVGIENLAIEFAESRYAAHHEEPGYNAIEFMQIGHAWARGLKITNADVGITLRQLTKFVTLDDIVFNATAGRIRDGLAGHHAIQLADRSQDNLVTRFDIPVRFVHDLAVTSLAAGNVFAQGRAIDLTMDHHRKAPYENLFTDLDAGEGLRLWLSGGDEDAGPHSAAREVFWNIRTTRVVPLPPWGIEMTLVGMRLATENSSPNYWIEPDTVDPSNLFLAQRQRVSTSAGNRANCAASTEASETPPVRVYPNPWRADRSLSPFITFDPGIITETDVRIFTLAGHVVKRLPRTTALPTWDLTNESGESVASGLYLFVLERGDGSTTRGRIAVIR